jgi:DNA polymerase-1
LTPRPPPSATRPTRGTRRAGPPRRRTFTGNSPSSRSWWTSWGWRASRVPGYEADDVLASLAKKAEKEGYEVRILTADRDLYQLLSDRIHVLHPEGYLITPAWLWEKYGLRPDQWADYRALTGDESDNLPGVKGIGEKTARKLLEEWGSLERLLKNLDRLRPAIREKILAHMDDLKLSWDLAKVRTDLPLEVDFAKRREPDRERLRAFLERLEFGSLLHEFGLLESPKALEEAPWPPPEGAFVGFVLSRKEPMWADLLALAAAREGRVHRAPEPYKALRDLKEARGLLAKDLSVLALREGLGLPPGDDPMLLAYLLDPSNTTPEGVARRYGGEWTEEAGERAALSERLFANLWGRLEGEERLLWLYREVERPLSAVLAHMEATGVRLDVAYLRALSLEVAEEIARLEAEVFRLAGHPFNLNSRDQLERVLFDELGLPAIGKTEKTGKRSTSAAVLEALREAHPIVEKILQYRELTKLKSTYIDPLPDLIHPRTGRLHTRFNQTATATGRLSSSDPNLQNIPVRTPLGQRIRRAFIAEEGWLLVALDYSQIELRVLAHLSGDENLIRVFQEGRDIHTETASWMFGVPREAVDPLMRRAAKTINFGVLYGMSAHRLSQELAIPYEEAQAFIERYFQSFPKVRAWIEKTLEEGRRRGYVETLFGRRRYVPDLEARVKSVREAAERMAFNMPVQGTAADLMKLAMVKLFPRLEEVGARMLLQVHDELVLEAPKERAEAVARLAKEVMEGVYPLAVPLVVEVGIGEDWLSAKE